MAKTPKKPWHKGKPDHTPREKDDGTRWLVVRHGKPVYPSHGGTTRAEADRLAAGLLEPAAVIQVSIA